MQVVLHLSTFKQNNTITSSALTWNQKFKRIDRRKLINLNYL